MNFVPPACSGAPGGGCFTARGSPEDSELSPLPCISTRMLSVPRVRRTSRGAACRRRPWMGSSTRTSATPACAATTMSANGRVAALAGGARKPAPPTTNSRNTMQRRQRRDGGMASAHLTTSKAVRLAGLEACGRVGWLERSGRAAADLESGDCIVSDQRLIGAHRRCFPSGGRTRPGAVNRPVGETTSITRGPGTLTLAISCTLRGSSSAQPPSVGVAESTNPLQIGHLSSWRRF